MAVVWMTKWKWNTGYSADSVEWCPVQPYCNVLVCGTYQLDKTDELPDQQSSTKQKRLGRIYLFIINKDIKDLEPVQTIGSSGILDQKWCHHTIQGYPVLAIVTSEGSLQLYRLVDMNGTVNLKLWIEDTIGQDTLALSLDWSTNRSASEEPKLVVSDSSGSVTVLQVSGDCLQSIGVWNSHKFEAWIAAFDYWNTDVFYSGGDDCIFKSYDLRVPQTATISNKTHEAGLTAIRSHVFAQHQILTGSYDEKVRLWDSRNLKRCVTETDVNGGVWRLKWHPFKPTLVLAACMYGGFRLLQVEESIVVLCEYLEHESIAYGADWKFDDTIDSVATCSFYDCKMHVGEIVLPIK